MPTTAQFQKAIRDYYRTHPRPMPWRRARDRRDPYRILISEIMLQQTQVARVIPFYENFIKKFPDFGKLARAKTSEVLKAWQGLGYNRRALALQKLAREVATKYNGKLPRGADELIKLPGIGPYTAGAIRAFAFNEPDIFIETNIRRVFIHFFFPPGKAHAKKVTDAALHRYIERTLDRKNPREWYWALMDYGAMLGSDVANPNRRSAHYTRQSKFAGSDREIRGKILRELLVAGDKTGNKKGDKKKISISYIIEKLVEPPERVSKILQGLAREGFIVKNGRSIRINN
jgi:A/G-specific adenine glycosylase